jgi:hypothetical protein
VKARGKFHLHSLVAGKSLLLGREAENTRFTEEVLKMFLLGLIEVEIKWEF